jgi:hypothetical protein
MDFTPKRIAEREVFTVDYAALLGTGETITTAVWSITAQRGIDASASAMIQGSATISGTKVSQVISGGLADVFYAPMCIATTSTGQALVLPEYGNGMLHVTA